MNDALLSIGSGLERYATPIVVAGIVAVLTWCARRFHQKVIVPTRDAILAMSEIVNAQLTTNGGGSLVDKVNKIEPYHDEVKLALEGSEKKNDERWSSLDSRLRTIEEKAPATVIVTTHQAEQAHVDVNPSAGAAP